MQRQNESFSAGTPTERYASETEGGALLSGTPSTDSERFFADLKTFVADSEALLRQAKTLSGEAAAAARVEFDRRLDEARQKYEAARSVALDRGQAYMDRTETYVRNEPWKAIGAAALVGAIVGVLLTRR